MPLLPLPVGDPSGTQWWAESLSCRQDVILLEQNPTLCLLPLPPTVQPRVPCPSHQCHRQNKTFPSEHPPDQICSAL